MGNDSSATDQTSHGPEGTAGEVYRPSCAGDDRPWTLAYECRPAVNALVEALRPFPGTGEFIIFRDAFRWKIDNGGDLTGYANRGEVVCNGYEMHGIESIAELLCAEVIWDFNHVGVLRKLNIRAPDVKEIRRHG